MKRFLMSVSAVLAAMTATAKVQLTPLFSDNMVFQQNCSAPVWGKAEPGAKVTVTPSWNRKDYVCTVSLNDSVLFGDADMNGKVDLDDAIAAMVAYNYVEIMDMESPLDPRAIADVDGNGKVDLSDAITIMTYYNYTQADLEPSWYELTGNKNAPDAPAET